MSKTKALANRNGPKKKRKSPEKTSWPYVKNTIFVGATACSEEFTWAR